MEENYESVEKIVSLDTFVKSWRKLWKCGADFKSVEKIVKVCRKLRSVEKIIKVWTLYHASLEKIIKVWKIMEKKCMSNEVVDL